MPRVILYGFSWPLLNAVIITCVLKSPRNNFRILSLLIFTPATALSPTFINLSPVFKPALKPGPSGKTFITLMVSSIMLNSTPIPKNLPAISSLTPCNSSEGIKTECGSSLLRIAVIAVSLSAAILTLSTYLFSIKSIISCTGRALSTKKKFFPGILSLIL